MISIDKNLLGKRQIITTRRHGTLIGILVRCHPPEIPLRNDVHMPPAKYEVLVERFADDRHTRKEFVEQILDDIIAAY